MAYYLGEMYRKGEGVTENNANACRYYIKSAEGKNKDAFLLAGACFIMGEGVEQDFEKGYEWLKKTSAEINMVNLNKKDQKYLMLTLANLSYLVKELYRISAKRRNGREERQNWAMPRRKSCCRFSCFPDRASFKIKPKPDNGQRKRPNKIIRKDL